MSTPLSRQTNTDERKGFTLIEMVVVIAIISILAAIAFVSMLHYRTVIRVNATARDMAGQMRIARAKAIRNGKSMMVNFNTIGGHYYTVGQDHDENGAYDTFWRTEPLQDGIVFGFFPGISGVPGHPSLATRAIDIRNGSQTYMHFRFDGTASFDGVVYLIPGNDLSATGSRDDRNRAVDWEAASGRVRAWKWKNKAHVWR